MRTEKAIRKRLAFAKGMKDNAQVELLIDPYSLAQKAREETANTNINVLKWVLNEE